MLNAGNEIAAAGQGTQKTVQTIDFGTAGNCEGFVSAGWSVAEDGFRWMTGVESELRIAQHFAAGDYLIELDVIPFLRPPAVPSQRLTVSVNDCLVGRCTVVRGARFGYRIPAAALASSTALSIVLGHPDAARPCDFGPIDDERLLALSVQRLRLSRIRQGSSSRQIAGTGGIAVADLEQKVGMAADRFMMQFESLGDNCEFGLVQRRCGAEPLSLLRFSAIELWPLLRGLDVGFHDFGERTKLEVRLEGTVRREYVFHEMRYGVAYHTFRYEGDVDADRLMAGEPTRLAFRVRKFLEDLRGGEKIFVCKRNIPLQEEETLPLYAALSSYGRIALVWVVPADAGHASGSVEVVAPGLFKGYIARFAPLDNAHDLLLDEWLEVCANAYELSRADRAAGPTDGQPPG